MGAIHQRSYHAPEPQGKLMRRERRAMERRQLEHTRSTDDFDRLVSEALAAGGRFFSRPAPAQVRRGPSERPSGTEQKPVHHRPVTVNGHQRVIYVGCLVMMVTSALIGACGATRPPAGHRETTFVPSRVREEPLRVGGGVAASRNVTVATLRPVRQEFNATTAGVAGVAAGAYNCSSEPARTSGQPWAGTRPEVARTQEPVCSLTPSESCEEDGGEDQVGSPSTPEAHENMPPSTPPDVDAEGFGEGPVNPLSTAEMTYRKVSGLFATIPQPERPERFSDGGGFTEGNALLVTKDAAETTRFRSEMIRHAKQSIEISGNFGGGAIFMDTMKDLNIALNASQELTVHLLFSRDFITADETRELEQLASHFPGRVHYQLSGRHFVVPAGSVENHVKLTVIDGKYAVVGGTGITDNFVTVGDKAPPEKEKKTLAEYVIPTAARDQDNIFRGSLAARARVEFFKLLRKWEKIETRADAPLRWFPVDEHKATSLPCVDASPRLDTGVKMKLLACGPEQ